MHEYFYNIALSEGFKTSYWVQKAVGLALSQDEFIAKTGFELNKIFRELFSSGWKTNMAAKALVNGKYEWFRSGPDDDQWLYPSGNLFGGTYSDSVDRTYDIAGTSWTFTISQRLPDGTGVQEKLFLYESGNIKQGTLKDPQLINSKQCNKIQFNEDGSFKDCYLWPPR